jgi:hypothetical protein
MEPSERRPRDYDELASLHRRWGPLRTEQTIPVRQKRLRLTRTAVETRRRTFASVLTQGQIIAVDGSQAMLGEFRRRKRGSDRIQLIRADLRQSTETAGHSYPSMTSRKAIGISLVSTRLGKASRCRPHVRIRQAG